MALIVGQNSRRVAVHVFKSKVYRIKLKGDSATFRVTVPLPLVTVLDLAQGDSLVWTYDAATRRITVAKGETPRR
jgi:hypothetical protein